MLQESERSDAGRAIVILRPQPKDDRSDPDPTHTWDPAPLHTRASPAQDDNPPRSFPGSGILAVARERAKRCGWRSVQRLSGCQGQRFEATEGDLVAADGLAGLLEVWKTPDK